MEKQIKVTYLAHSGFLVETERHDLLFDYSTGKLPGLASGGPPSSGKPFYVFVSHSHGDHFNPEIFRLPEIFPQVFYVLSDDVVRKPGYRENRKNLAPERILSVKPDQSYDLADLRITTLRSTDAGVAFLVETEGITVYHAGDLNWWFWKEESRQWNNDMTARYQKELEKMRDVPIDLAFLPLDPRQEEYYYLGFESMLKAAKVRYAVPMHMWGVYSLARKLREDGHLDGTGTNVLEVTGNGQEITLSLPDLPIPS
ncbi:MAG: MBL fold metallo-hydrolase [Clostridium sp.]|jgi:L-ascorbate metabolism protein UlaG (beta-lactamase superfamily)|nr:MBL fold metallo-hydrolase [Clostridium sp.]